jgi:hypothetical protein
METHSKIYENVGEVRALHIVGGEENTPSWEGTISVPRLDLTFGGVAPSQGVRNRHYGRTRIARGYQLGDWAGRVVRNERQVSVATSTDIRAIADELGISPIIEKQGFEVDGFMAEALAVNVCINGEALGLHLGPGARLFIGAPNTGAILDISEAHLPCKKPPFTIARELSIDPEALKLGFKRVAAERRGFMSSVYAPGSICLGDQISIQQPIDHRTERMPWR